MIFRQKLSVVDMSIAEIMMILIMISLWLFITETPEPKIASNEAVIGSGIILPSSCATKINTENFKVDGYTSGITYEENKFDITINNYACMRNICGNIATYIESDPINNVIDIIGFASNTKFNEKTTLGFYVKHSCAKIGKSKGCNELLSWLRAKRFIDSCNSTVGLSDRQKQNNPSQNLKSVWSDSENELYRKNISINAFGNWKNSKSQRNCHKDDINCKEGRLLEIYFKKK